MATYTCPRCGEEHELDEDPAFTKDSGCSECDHWVQCDHCGKWVESTHSVRCGDGMEEWCDECADDHSFSCGRCGTVHHNSDEIDVHNRGVESWCPSCADRYTWRCANCDALLSSREDSHSTENGEICSCCVDDHYYCEDCNLWFPDGEDCNCDSSSSGRFRVAGYGQHGDFKIRNNWGTVRLKPPAIGLEMEVGNFPGRSSRDDFGDEVYADLGNDFAYPTADGSLGEYGIEFIGHPIGAMDHVSMYEKYGQFFDGLIEHNATVSENPSGCHTNFGKECFVSEDAIRCAIIACVRFYDALMMFTDAGCVSKRMTYCKVADLYSGEDPISQCRSNGKYSIVNIKEHDGAHGIVEFRLAGMTLDRDRHLAQIQLYHNLVAWANKNHENNEAASYASFGEIFLPVLFQDSIKDVIVCGEKIGSLPLGDPSIMQSNADGVTTFRGAVGHVLDFVVGIAQRNCVYDVDFRAKPGDVVVIDGSMGRKTIICTSDCRVASGDVSIYRPTSAWPTRGGHGQLKWIRTPNLIRYFFNGQYATFRIAERNAPTYTIEAEQALLPTEFPGE